jgi:hypothetical protein
VRRRIRRLLAGTGAHAVEAGEEHRAFWRPSSPAGSTASARRPKLCSKRRTPLPPSSGSSDTSSSRPPKIAIGRAFLEAGGERDGAAARAADGLRRTVGSLLDRAQHAGAVRTDIDLPTVCTLLVAASHMSGHIDLATEVKDRALAILLDGLAVRRRTDA